MNTNSSGYEMMAKSVFIASSTLSTEDIQPFACSTGHGFSSVTLLGTKADWIETADKVTQMERGAFGKASSSHANSLRPLFTRFIATFDLPNNLASRLFWSDMVTAALQQPLCHTINIISRWVNAFHFWDGAGYPLSLDFLGRPATIQLHLIIFFILGERSRTYPPLIAK
jgi:hypothetical protein